MVTDILDRVHDRRNWVILNAQCMRVWASLIEAKISEDSAVSTKILKPTCKKGDWFAIRDCASPLTLWDKIIALHNITYKCITYIHNINGMQDIDYIPSILPKFLEVFVLVYQVGYQGQLHPGIWFQSLQASSILLAIWYSFLWEWYTCSLPCQVTTNRYSVF